jgi:hypothetical protein
MKTYDFTVTIAHDNLDCEVLVDALRDAVHEALPTGTLALVKASGVNEYSEQGWKVARNRKFGISVADAGDGVNRKGASKESELATA